MNKSARNQLAAFQHVDSFFPSATVSFSWGIETLSHQGVINSAQDLQEYITTQLTHRWASFDRPILVHSHARAGDLDLLIKLDQLVEAQTLAREFREGSKRMGTALLSTHAKLALAASADYATCVRRGEAHGHLAVVQGLVWQHLGFDEETIQPMAFHGMCTGMLGAAVRLAVICHLDAQRILRALHEIADDILPQPVLAIDDLHSFTPQTDIASMIHETEHSRLFAN